MMRYTTKPGEGNRFASVKCQVKRCPQAVCVLFATGLLEVAPVQAACPAVIAADRVRSLEATPAEYAHFGEQISLWRRYIAVVQSGGLPAVNNRNSVSSFIGDCSEDERGWLMNAFLSGSSGMKVSDAKEERTNEAPLIVLPTAGGRELTVTVTNLDSNEGDPSSPALENADSKQPASIPDPAGDSLKKQQGIEYTVRKSPEGGWLTGIDLGYQLQPDYDEGGRSSGFNQHNLFGRLFVDGVVGPKRNWHLGLDLLFAEFPTVREPSETNESGDEALNRVPDSFNDVDDSVVASIYAFREWSAWYADENNDGDLHAERLASPFRHGPILRTGLSTREILKQDGVDQDGNPTFDSDKLVYWGGLGYRFVYLDRDADCGTDCIRSGYNRGEFEVIPAYYEDYIGKDHEWRWLLSFRYRLLESAPLYVSFLGNAGQGDDIVSIGLSYVLDPDNIFSGVAETFKPTR